MVTNKALCAPKWHSEYTTLKGKVQLKLDMREQQKRRTNIFLETVDQFKNKVESEER